MRFHFTLCILSITALVAASAHERANIPHFDKRNAAIESPGPHYSWLEDKSRWWQRLTHRGGHLVHRPANSSSPTSGPPSLPPDCQHSAESCNCWSNGFNINTDSHSEWPQTGVTRSYSLELTNGTGAPDGIERPMFFVNGRYPGPTIYANWGDWVEVSVVNRLQDNGTGIHWHGIRQWYTNAEDGVPGVTECPTAPGHTKVYRWQATQYGTSWYHSHMGAQYGDGILGAIVIDGPSTANYDYDLGPLPITDWYYQTASARSWVVAHTNGRPPTEADNGLINGTMMSQQGTGSYYVTEISQGKRYKIRLINTSSDNSFMVSLDRHAFTAIAADFGPIEPYKADWIFLTIGQRYDVIIDADQLVGNYWFRAEVQDQPNPNCGTNKNNGNIKSIFRYYGAPASNPNTQATPYQQRCSNEVVVPCWNTLVPSEGLVEGGQLNSSIQFGVNSINQTVVKWGLDTTPLYVQWNQPTLETAWEGNSSFPEAANVISLPNEGEWIYWIIQEVAGTPITISLPHPIHLHGHDFFVLGQGVGNFSDTGGSTLNYDNPVRRDTVMMPAAGWLALGFPVDNPGPWLMHCHISWHANEGMGVQFLELENLIGDIAEPVYSFEETCRGWSAYYPENAAYVRDADDSGI